MELATPQILNLIGLSLDIIGVIMLFKYGLPAEVDRYGNDYILGSPDNEEEKKKWIKYDRCSKIALLVIILGFGFQIAATFASGNSVSKPKQCTDIAEKYHSRSEKTGKPNWY